MSIVATTGVVFCTEVAVFVLTQLLTADLLASLVANYIIFLPIAFVLTGAISDMAIGLFDTVVHRGKLVLAVPYVRSF